MGSNCSNIPFPVYRFARSKSLLGVRAGNGKGFSRVINPQSTPSTLNHMLLRSDFKRDYRNRASLVKDENYG